MSTKTAVNRERINCCQDLPGKGQRLMGLSCNRESNKVAAGVAVRSSLPPVLVSSISTHSPAAMEHSSSEWEQEPPRDLFLLLASISLARCEAQSLNSVANFFWNTYACKNFIIHRWWWRVRIKYGVFFEMSDPNQVLNCIKKLCSGQHFSNIFFYNANGIKLFYLGFSLN